MRTCPLQNGAEQRSRRSGTRCAIREFGSYMETAMAAHTQSSPIMTGALKDVRILHERLLSAWNSRDAKAMASLYAPNGGQVGFDGSTANGRDEIEALLEPIFADHPTARFVAIVREVRALGADAALLLSCRREGHARCFS
jgi:hypothetical protein